MSEDEAYEAGAHKASRLIEALGNDAWPTLYRESRDLDLPEDERLFHLAVRRKVEKRLGIEPRVDVATRYTDQLSLVLLVAAGEPLSVPAARTTASNRVRFWEWGLSEARTASRRAQHAKHADAAMTEAVTIAAEAITEATEVEYDEKGCTLPVAIRTGSASSRLS